MTTDALVPVRVNQVSAGSHLRWAEGMSFSLPKSVLDSSGLGKHVDQAGNLNLPSEIAPIAFDHVRALRLRAAFTERPPASSRMPISYQNVPHWARTAIASVIGRWKRRSAEKWAAFPRWPLDLSADFLADLCRTELPRRPTPVWLTHDLDSPEGLHNLVKWFLDAEEAVGARSTNFIVPCAWSVDHELLRQVTERGHEVGIHGFDHANRTPFENPSERRKRLDAARELIDRYHVIGYRSPSLLRTRALLRDLSTMYRFDSSIPISGGLFPVPNNGCASARPFEVEGIIEIPVSLPRDGSLRFLGHAPEQIVRIWIDCAEKISGSGGVVVLLTHCEARFSGNARMLRAYREFLEYVNSSDRFAWNGPGQLLERVR